MKKEDLIAMGLTEEQAKQVMDSLNGNYVTKSRFNEVNEEKKTLEQSVADRDKQFEELKKSSGDNAELKKQIEELQKSNAEQKKAHEAEIAQLKLDNAFEAALTSAGAKNIKIARSAFDMSKITLDEKGELSGFNNQLKEIMKTDAYLFAEKQQPSFSGLEPSASGDVKPDSGIDTSQMTYSQLSAYLEANPNTSLDIE